ncbi:hypothetical protein, partial [Pseudomonas alabamensis]
MTHTLVAAFDTLTEAQAAKRDLLAQQVLESNIELSSSELHAAEGRADDTAHHESFGEKVSHFFSSLFGTDEHDANKPHRYATAYPELSR